MNNSTKFEDRASSSPSTHEGEPSESLCDRLSRTRDTSQRQLPTDQDYAVSTREYQTDQSSLKHASTAACPVLEKQQKQPQRKQPHRFAGMDRVTPYQRFVIRCGPFGIASERRIPVRHTSDVFLPRCQRPACDLAHWNSPPPRCTVLPLVIGELLDAGAVEAHYKDLAVRLRRIRVCCFILETHP
jgi:hypothetical protein